MSGIKNNVLGKLIELNNTLTETYNPIKNIIILIKTFICLLIDMTIKSSSVQFIYSQFIKRVYKIFIDTPDKLTFS